jgi:hypothetical protein
VLRAEYGSYELRDCWANHSQAIWELSTPAAEWHNTDGSKRPDLARALECYDRWQPNSVRRVADLTPDLHTWVRAAPSQLVTRLQSEWPKTFRGRHRALNGAARWTQMDVRIMHPSIHRYLNMPEPYDMHMLLGTQPRLLMQIRQTLLLH